MMNMSWEQIIWQIMDRNILQTVGFGALLFGVTATLHFDFRP